MCSYWQSSWTLPQLFVGFCSKFIIFHDSNLAASCHQSCRIRLNTDQSERMCSVCVALLWANNQRTVVFVVVCYKVGMLDATPQYLHLVSIAEQHVKPEAKSLPVSVTILCTLLVRACCNAVLTNHSFLAENMSCSFVLLKKIAIRVFRSRGLRPQNSSSWVVFIELVMSALNGANLRHAAHSTQLIEGIIILCKQN